MVNTKDRNKRLVIGASLVAVLMLGGFGWFSYQDWEEIGRLKEDADSIRGKIARGVAEIAQIPRAEDEVLVLRERVLQYVAVLPDDTNISAFVDKLTEFARISGVSITKLDDTAAKTRKVRREKAREAFDRITYKLSMTATCSEFLRFLDLFENEYERFVNVPTFSIKGFDAKGKIDVAEHDRDHEIDLEIETYVYNPKSKGGDQVAIPGEAKKTERLRRDGVMDAGPGIVMARFDYLPREGRSDPFVDPRLAMRTKSDPKVSEAERIAQQKLLEKLTADWQKVRDVLAREEKITDAVRRIQAQQDTDSLLRGLFAEVKDLNEKNFFSVPEYAASFRNDVHDPVHQLAEKRMQSPSLMVGARDIELRVEAMEAALKAQEFDRVVALFQELQQLKSRVAPDADVIAFWERGEECERRAKVYMDFEKMEFKFGGAICYGTDDSQAVIIINERSFSPGETVSDGLVIRKISPHDITFDYRGIDVSRRHAVDGGR